MRRPGNSCGKTQHGSTYDIGRIRTKGSETVSSADGGSARRAHRKGLPVFKRRIDDGLRRLIWVHANQQAALLQELGSELRRLEGRAEQLLHVCEWAPCVRVSLAFLLAAGQLLA